MSGNGRTNGPGARAAIVAFLETIRRPEQSLADIGDDDHLVQSGLIDSLTMLEIVAFLEETWGVGVEDEELVPENFDSIARLTMFVEKKKPVAAE